MADQQDPPQGDKKEPQGTDQQQGKENPPAPPPPTQDTTDWKAEARKWEARAKKDAAALQRVNEALTEKDASAKQAQAAADAATAIALRYRIAAEFKLPPELADRLRGESEEDIRADAKVLGALSTGKRTDAKDGSGQQPPPPAKPNPNDLLRLIAGHR